MVPKFATAFVAQYGFVKCHYHSICSLKVARLAEFDKIFGDFWHVWHVTTRKIEQDYYQERVNMKISSREISKFQENL